VEDLIIIIIEQPMFLAAVLSALEQPHLRDLHHHWTGGITSLISPNQKTVQQDPQIYK
jgi:hypothetical protein